MRSASTVRLWTTVGVLGPLLGAWLTTGLSPRFETGAVASFPAPLVEDAGDGPGGGSWGAIDPAPGEARFVVSYRSTSPVPVTVSAVPDQLVVSSTHLTLVDERTPFDGAAPQEPGPVTELRVPRGGTVAVWQTLDFPCAAFTAGSGTGMDEVVLDVTTLGLTRRLHLPLERSVAVWTSTDRTCPASS